MKRVIFSFAIAAILFTGCNKDEYEPMQAAITNQSEVTALAQGQSLTLKASVTSALETTIAWSVDEQTVAGATGETFDFSSAAVGEHVISLTVTNREETVSDQITVTVYYQIDFENPDVIPYVATANSGSGVFNGGYVDEVSGLKMPASVDSVWGSWSGIAISQFNDMLTEGYNNQLSAYYSDAATGFGGYEGSKTFAVNYNSEISFNDSVTEGEFFHLWITNSTYAALSMKNGDSFAKKFKQGDWLKLTINAYDKTGNPTGTVVEFYLADFRTTTSPGIITEWTKVDLTPLGNRVHTIKFDMQSTDNNEYGMATPAYFCFDNLAFIK